MERYTRSAPAKQLVNRPGKCLKRSGFSHILHVDRSRISLSVRRISKWNVYWVGLSCWNLIKKKNSQNKSDVYVESPKTTLIHLLNILTDNIVQIKQTRVWVNRIRTQPDLAISFKPELFNTFKWGIREIYGKKSFVRKKYFEFVCIHFVTVTTVHDTQTISTPLTDQKRLFYCFIRPLLKTRVRHACFTELFPPYPYSFSVSNLFVRSDKLSDNDVEN